jgi:hypothetical protein
LQHAVEETPSTIEGYIFETRFVSAKWQNLNIILDRFIGSQANKKKGWIPQSLVDFGGDSNQGQAGKISLSAKLIPNS